jgi:hypothetical protein
MKLILLIILLIIVIYLYNQTLIETKKEYLDTEIKCTKNCGNYNIDRTSTNISICLACDSCGVCTLPNKNQICMNGNKDGAYFNDDCSGSNWKYGNTTTTTTKTTTKPISTDYDYEYQLKMIGQTDNLPSKATKVSYLIPNTEPQRRSSTISNDTTNALSNLLNKINSTKQNDGIDKDTVKKLQQILNKLTSSTS